MTGLQRALLAIAVLCIAAPAAAQSPSPPTAAFDGTYAGVSRQHSRIATTGGTNCPVPDGVPASLTITGGLVRSPNPNVNWEGIVVIRGTNAFRIDARIDPQGAIRGSGSGGACSYEYVWQKRAR